MVKINILEEVSQAVIKGDSEKLSQALKRGLQQKIAASELIERGLIKGMCFIGNRFKANEIFIPEVMISASAMQTGLDILEPFLVKEDYTPLATIVIGTVKGDLHDIGKNLVKMMFKGAGFKVLDLGIDVDAQKFIQAAKNGAEIIAMSSLLTTSMSSMGTVIKQLEKDNLLQKVKTMVGGAPVNASFAKSIGADGYAQDAASAVDKAKELLGICK